MEKIYLVFTCDKHKTTSSMRLRAILDSAINVKGLIKKLIKNEVIDEVKFPECNNVEMINDKIPEIYVHSGYIGEIEDDGGCLI